MPEHSLLRARHTHTHTAMAHKSNNKALEKGGTRFTYESNLTPHSLTHPLTHPLPFDSSSSAMSIVSRSTLSSSDGSSSVWSSLVIEYTRAAHQLALYHSLFSLFCPCSKSRVITCENTHRNTSHHNEFMCTCCCWQRINSRQFSKG